MVSDPLVRLPGSKLHIRPRPERAYGDSRGVQSVDEDLTRNESRRLWSERKDQL